MVVLADEDHRQLPQSSHVHGLMESALIAAAVTEEGNTDALGGVQRAIKSMAGAQSLGSTHDAVGAHEANLGSGLVHLTGTAGADAVLTAHQLCHHGVDISALGDQVAVAAVGRGDIVFLGQSLADAGSNSFLTDIHMHVADNDALLEVSNSTFLKHTDQPHHAVHFNKLFFC